jgi:hypothetical protein
MVWPLMIAGEIAATVGVILEPVPIFFTGFALVIVGVAIHEIHEVVEQDGRPWRSRWTRGVLEGLRRFLVASLVLVGLAVLVKLLASGQFAVPRLSAVSVGQTS